MHQKDHDPFHIFHIYHFPIGAIFRSIFEIENVCSQNKGFDYIPFDIK